MSEAYAPLIEESDGYTRTSFFQKLKIHFGSIVNSIMTVFLFVCFIGTGNNYYNDDHDIVCHYRNICYNC